MEQEVTFAFITPEGYRHSITCWYGDISYHQLVDAGYSFGDEKALRGDTEMPVNRIDSTGTFYEIQNKCGEAESDARSDEAEDIREWEEFRRRNAGGE